MSAVAFVEPDLESAEVRVSLTQFGAEAAVADLISMARTTPDLIDPSGVAEMADSLTTLAAWLAPKH